ncbi:MAG: GC-type dockerin domain-anchored protein [Phycisphaerales bacterium JB052]
MLKKNAGVLCGVLVSLCAGGVSAQRYTDERYDLALIQQESSIEPDGVAGGDNVGASLAMSMQYIVVGTPGREVDGVSDAGCVYVYDTQTQALLYTLTSPTPGVGDEFGFAVALDGDLLCVGVPNDDQLVEDGGAVFLFDLSTGIMLEKLLPDNPDAFDRFGISVAVNTEYIAAGNLNDNDAGQFVGSIEVFDRVSHAHIGKLLPDDPSDLTGVGRRIAMNGDGLVAGAAFSNLGGVDAGAALLFELSTMSHVYTVQGGDTASGDQFGGAVAITDDRIYVGAENNDDYGVDGGAVYMFDRATGEELVQMWPHDFDQGNSFGSAIHVDGDRLIIGARKNDTEGINRGRVYLFNARTGQLQASFQRDAAFNNDQLGVALAALGDEVIASSVRARADGNLGGKVYRFTIGNERYPDRIFEGEDCSNFNYNMLGEAIDIDGDTLVASGSNAGFCFGAGPGVYVYDIPTMTRLHVITNNPGTSGNWFGESIAVGDGVIAVGAPYDSTIEDRAGVVYLYDQGSGAFLMELRPDDIEGHDEFGASLDIDGGVLAVGCKYVDDGDVPGTGGVYLYALPSGEFIRKQVSPTPGNADEFGWDVHLDNGMLLVGSPRDDDLFVGRGAAFLFDVQSGEHLRTYLPYDTDDTFPDEFGRSVFMRDGVVIVGDPYATVPDSEGDPVDEAGQVHVFDRDTGNELARLHAETPYAEQLFGWSVGADGDAIYAGTWRLYGFNSNYGPDNPRVERFDATTFERMSQVLASYSFDETYFGRSIAVSDAYTAIGMSNGHYQYAPIPELGGTVFVYDNPQGDTCTVDLNNDGELNFFDVSAFIVAFSQGDLGVDFTGDGELNFFDVSAFIIAYSKGCP